MICGKCGATTAGADVFLNLEGVTVCRRCYYAEQTALQGARAKESNRQVGFFAAITLFRRLFLGGIGVLVGAAALLGGVREGAWRVAGIAALFVALGVFIIVVALKRAGHTED